MADRASVADATLVSFRVDEAPARVAFGRRGLGGTGLLVAGLLGAAALWAVNGGDARPSPADFERGVRSQLSGELLGDARVGEVSCARAEDAHARCVAEFFDRSGSGPRRESFTVTLDGDGGAYVRAMR